MKMPDMSTLYARGTFTGKPDVSSPEEIAAATYLIGNEYAPGRHGDGDVNYLLAGHLARQSRLRPELPVFVAPTIARPLAEIAPDVRISGVFKPVSSDLFGRVGGTPGELLQGREMMGEGWERPLIIAQAFHAGRVALHAVKLGMTPALPAGLPRVFDWNSKQPWCTDPLLWAAREIPGALYLKLRKQI